MVDVFKLYERMQDNNIMLSFKGEISFDLVQSVLDIIEGKLEQIEGSTKTKKRVYNVLVECLQNLCYHVEEQADQAQSSSALGDGYFVPDRSALLMIWTDPGIYHVATGNYIPNENVQKLKSWLDEINGMGKEELRERYKQILGNEQYSEKGTAGLGFLDIARKSGQQLHYEFSPIDERYSFFSFQINIPKE